MLEMICEQLGVGIEEEWLGNDYYKYKITENGKLQWWLEEEGWSTLSGEWYRRLLAGELKPLWEPKNGIKYYVPCIFSSTEYVRYQNRVWDSNDEDWHNLKRGLVCKTKEEAIGKANKMLKVLKNE